MNELINLKRHPLDRPGDPDYEALVSETRTGLAANGCAVLPGFIDPAALQVMSGEILEMKPRLHESRIAINPYFSEGDQSMPEDHPVNTFIERSGGFIPRDAFIAESVIDAVYKWPPLLSFVADCLGLPKIHCFADPLAGLTINSLDPGEQFSWHYDTNDFAVTILVDEADNGGLFQYSPNIRSANDENFAGVKACQNEDLTTVKTLDLSAGDLQIFRGRFSLHRVTRVAHDSRPRHTAVFAYTEAADVIGRLERTKQLFGRTLPEHEKAEQSRIRNDSLRD
ncbi:MAG: arpA protein [Actinomycetota bacterium]|nr:arpA protein [Actinomycetota bacterium]